MRALPKIGSVTGALFVMLAVGCQASVESDDLGASAGGSGSSSGSGSGSTSNTAGTQNLAGGVALPPGAEATALLPARIRRLSVAEYQATVSDSRVIGADAKDVGAHFVPDSRQDPKRGGFTVNEAQRVDPVFARQLSEAAIKLAASIRQHAVERAPCAPGADPAECAESFIRGFGEQAYRRPLGDDEVEHLLTVFNAALDGGSYEEGIELVARAMLQSASFLYLTEIGDAPAVHVKLTPYELASSISYLIQGGPPSQDLLERAKRGDLDAPEGRARLAVDAHLFEGGDAATRISRVVREWLGTDRVSEIAKDTNVYGGFADAQSSIARETTEFLNGLVQIDGGGSLQQLLAGNWTMADAKLASVYGVSGVNGDAFVRIDTPKRLGILNQAAFQSVFAHATETAPVLRGVAVMRRVACVMVGDPTDLGIAVVPPVPDPSKTVRERFSVHSADANCSSCHKLIDNFGFAFEHFDGMGRFVNEDDHGHTLDSSVSVVGTDFDGSYPDSNALATAMSTSPQVRECFARHMFRALAATSDPKFSASEDEFVKYWDTTLTRANDQVTDVSIIGTVSSYITSPAFNYRRGQ
jgi:hypothetical protein